MSAERKVVGPLGAWVDEQIASGRYATEDDVIEAGLIALADRDAKQRNVQRLIQEGLDAIAEGDVYKYESLEAAISDVTTAKLG